MQHTRPDRAPARPSLSRRAFLKRLATLSLPLPVLSKLLSACGVRPLDLSEPEAENDPTAVISAFAPTPTARGTSEPVPSQLPTLSPQPPMGTPEPAVALRFAVIGDYGLAGEPARAVADMVHSWEPDLIITTGDNNYPHGAAATLDQNVGQYYHQYIHPYHGAYGTGAISNRFFPSLGNHDWEVGFPEPYLAYFELPGNERYYTFEWSGVRFFALDSALDEPDGISSDAAQAEWLKNELAASQARWNLVYFHHAPYSSGHHGSSVWMRWPFAEWGADAVLAGHDHNYERVMVAGMPYFVNGLGGGARYAPGAQAVPGSESFYNADHGAMLVDVTGATILFQFITRTGEIIDSYELHKP